MGFWFKIPLWARVFIGLVLGAALGLWHHYGQGADGAADANWIAAYVQPIGAAFVDLIKMLIVPLIFSTLVAGVIAMGDPKRLGSLGAGAIALYLGTTLFAVCLGLVFGTLLQPGAGVDVAAASDAARQSVSDSLGRAEEGGGFISRFLSFNIPGAIETLTGKLWLNLALAGFLIGTGLYFERRDPVNALAFPALVIAGILLAKLNIITVIVFALLVGIVFLATGGSLRPAARVIERAAETSMKVTTVAMEAAPFGVAALMAYVMSEYGLGILDNLLRLALALYLACIVHIALTYGGIVKFVLRLPLIRFFRGVIDAQAVAFSTASSSATLPVTIDCATRNLGIRKSVAGSVLPLGATINMDGTAIYLGIVGLFAAQAFQIPIDPIDYLMIAGTATLASVGAAGIPSAGLFLAYTVLSVFTGPDGARLITPEMGVLVIAFIFPFDRLLDMMRTLTNVTGDLAVASTVAKWQGELDEEIFRTPAT